MNLSQYFTTRSSVRLANTRVQSSWTFERRWVGHQWAVVLLALGRLKNSRGVVRVSRHGQVHRGQSGYLGFIERCIADIWLYLWLDERSWIELRQVDRRWIVEILLDTADCSCWQVDFMRL